MWAYWYIVLKTPTVQIRKKKRETVYSRVDNCKYNFVSRGSHVTALPEQQHEPARRREHLDLIALQNTESSDHLLPCTIPLAKQSCQVLVSKQDCCPPPTHVNICSTCFQVRNRVVGENQAIPCSCQRNITSCVALKALVLSF